MTQSNSSLSPVEHIKASSRLLRGTLQQSLADTATGALAEDDTQLSKFHGIYQQDDRDVRDERRRALLEPDYQFMIRARVPAGTCSNEQWLAMDAIGRQWANNSLRLTTRQAFQFHGILKKDLKTSIAEINQALLDTFAACGDVNRNVMASPLPELSLLHRQVEQVARDVSDHLTPNTRAYHEIWLNDGETRTRVDSATPAAEGVAEEEPLHGKTYLPRKFKIGFAIPPRNDTDLYSQDLGFIAINGEHGLEGFNVLVGGGMGTTHGDAKTFPRLGELLGFCAVGQAVAVAEAVVKAQRDHGNRQERKQARLKYTIERLGLSRFKQEVEQRLDFVLQPHRPFSFSHSGDLYGWQRSSDGLWHLGLLIENGRIADGDQGQHLTGMRKLAQLGLGGFRLSPNQNVIVSGVPAQMRPKVDEIVQQHGLDLYQKSSPLRRNAMACVGFPTCGLAMAESERYLPELVGRVDKLLQKHGVGQQDIIIRMTGCPNGCARPFLAEIGLVGKGPGRYNLHLGAAADGSRLNQMVRENINEADILQELDGWISAWASESADGAPGAPGESFGDFCFRRLQSNSEVAA